MLEPEFKILKTLNEYSNISQRKMSKEVGVSLGKVNSIIKKLSTEGFINKIETKNSIEYKVTSKGIKVLKENIQRAKSIRIQIHEEKDVYINEAVILAAGKREDFDIPIALLEIKREKLIERTIKLLKKNGVEKIVIVAGYKHDMFKEIVSKYESVELVINTNYNNTGTMSSMAIAEKSIKGDFLLIESDLVFQEKAICELLNSKERDCILITNKSGSGDETFVEIKDGYLFKMGKDIHQFNKINGEVVGITKISLKLFKLMLAEFKHNENPYINYEHTLLDVARSYNVGYIKIDNISWGEIDNIDQYNNVINNIIPNIERIERK